MLILDIDANLMSVRSLVFARPNRLETITRLGGVVQNFHYDAEGRVDHDWFTMRGLTGARDWWFEYTSFDKMKKITAEHMPATLRPGCANAVSGVVNLSQCVILSWFGAGASGLRQIREHKEFCNWPRSEPFNGRDSFHA